MLPSRNYALARSVFEGVFYKGWMPLKNPIQRPARPCLNTEFFNTIGAIRTDADGCAPYAYQTTGGWITVVARTVLEPMLRLRRVRFGQIAEPMHTT
jgi:hypothetical protein